MKYDVIIIGSGLGGLVCGYVLTRMGRRVVILEQDAQVGGCLQCYRRNGTVYDTGFHYVGGLDGDGALGRVFRRLNLLHLPWKQLDRNGFDRVILGRQSYALHNGYDAFAESLASLFPSDSDALKQYMHLLSETDEHQLDFLNPSADPCRTPVDLMDIGAYDYLTDTFHSKTLINLLSAASTRLELRRETLPLFTFVHVMSSYVRSSWRLVGGGSLIAKSLCNDILQGGGTIVTNSRVNHISADGKDAVVTTEDGRQWEGWTVISDLHPARTLELLESKAIKKIYRRRIERLENTCGMVTVSLQLKPRTTPYFNCNYFVYRSDDVWNLSGASIPQGVMVSAQVPEKGRFTKQVDLITPVDWNAVERWEGTGVGNREEEYEGQKRLWARQCMELAERVLPDLRHHVEKCWVSTPLTWLDYTSSPQGSAFGVRKDWHQPFLTMLSTRTPVNNVRLTGQSLKVHGIEGVTMTALETCAGIVGKDDLWQWLNR